MGQTNIDARYNDKNATYKGIHVRSFCTSIEKKRFNSEFIRPDNMALFRVCDDDGDVLTSIDHALGAAKRIINKMINLGTLNS